MKQTANDNPMTPTPGRTLPTAINGRIVGTATAVSVEGKRVWTAGKLWWEWSDELQALVKPDEVHQIAKAQDNHV